MNTELYKNYKKSEFSDKIDNVVTTGLVDTLAEFASKLSKELSDDTFHNVVTDELEFLSRDGFSAFSHNWGGIDVIAFSTVRDVVWGGYDYHDAQRQWNSAYEQIKKDNPEITDEEKLYEMTDEYCSDEYMGMAYRVRVMYHDENELTVWYGWANDAPYYRMHGDFKEVKIKFKDADALETKLTKLVDKIIKAM